MPLLFSGRTRSFLLPSLSGRGWGWVAPRKRRPPRQSPRRTGHSFESPRRSAQHGFTPLRRSAEHGFTLVELMVVLVIIGLMSGVVLLTMGDPRGGLSDDADRFAGRVRAARDRAVILARPVALWVSPTGYGFEERRDGRWTPLDQKPLVSTDWRSGTQASAGQARLRLWFDTIGRADQQISFTLQRNGRSLPVAVGLDGTVTR
ncbi:MAG: GspH/FimT family pseudopilin [Sphingobium sp.]